MDLRAIFERHGQGHVFQFWEGLDAGARTELESQLREVDLVELERLNQTLVQGASSAGQDWSRLEPAPYIPLPEHGGDAAAWAAAAAHGEALLRAGKVAVFTVAGGQGTRLGYEGPKGTFPVTPVRKATLFQVFAEKIAAAGRRFGRTPHWFIMTSHQNHQATESFFQEHRFFGLDSARVHFFRQGRMPAVDLAGKLLLETKGSLAMSPDGHGGSLRALVRSGATERMRAEGVEILSYFQVDNPLVRFIDPAFIGFHSQASSELSSKMVPKAYAGEKVGHFCRYDGKTVVVEYSDLPKELQERTDASGLVFKAGSVAIHLLDRSFIERMGSASDSGLPFHRADKKIPCVDANAEPVKPAKPNGVKFELFVFDALPFARNPIILEARRADDFSPVKNAEGLDSPKTCAEDLLRQYARWVRAQAVDLPVDATGLPHIQFEVSPLFGYDEASFAESWQRARPVIGPGTVLT